ncbi:MinD/ParA family protein [Actinomadura sp. 9N407]|uniref:MinD/ParA family protein n=1 Tax=Actinomadura sp. 9N407 TaxID=3375154 RepID=UPI0037A97CF9
MTSIRGGAGKSSLAALIARTVQQHRDDRVLAIDADPGLGSLPLRLGVTPTRSVHDVVAARPRTWEDAAEHLAAAEAGVWVLAGTTDAAIGLDLDHTTLRAGAGILGRYFAVSVIDCGAGIGSPIHRGVLDSAHAQIFAVPGTGDGAVSAHSALEWLRTNGYSDLLTRTVVALVAHTPSPDTDLEGARDLLGAGGLPVTIVPFDRHLAAGTAIHPDHLAETTHTAITTIALESFTRAQSGGAP